jgi:hypothetical protein
MNRALGGLLARDCQAEFGWLEGRWGRPGSAPLSRRRLLPSGEAELEIKAAKLAAIQPVQYQNKNPMIRISFETQSDSQDVEHPEAWRQEAAAVLRSITKRISSGEAMPLILQNREGSIIGKARELSYQPEPVRQSAVKLPFGS